MKRPEAEIPIRSGSRKCPRGRERLHDRRSLAHATGGEAGMGHPEPNGRAARIEVIDEQLGEMASRCLLQRQSPCDRVERAHDGTESREPCSREVDDVRFTDRRKQMMRAHRRHPDRAERDDVVRPRAVDLEASVSENLRWIMLVSAQEVVDPSVGDEGGGLCALSGRRLTDGCQERRHRFFGCLPVHEATILCFR